MGKKREKDSEYELSSVLSKPAPAEQKEQALKEKRKKRAKTFVAAAVIVAIAVGLTVVLTVFKPFSSIPTTPESVLKKYVSALNARDYEKLRSCLSPDMLNSVNENYGDNGAQLLFNNIFSSSLKEQFGESVRFKVENMHKTGNKLENGVYMGVDYKSEYNADELIIITCDILTIGDKVESTPTYVNMLHIDGKWYIDNMTE